MPPDSAAHHLTRGHLPPSSGPIRPTGPRVAAAGRLADWRRVMGLLVLGSGAACVQGCDDPTAIRPTDVRRYLAPVARPLLEPNSAAGSGSEPALRYEVPDGWSEGAAAGGIRLATLLIGEPGSGREVTVIPASGTLRDNLERWQRQLDAQGDPAAVAKAVDRAIEEAETVAVDGVPATVVLLEGPAGDREPEAILGGVVPLDEGRSLFVKFRGSLETAREQRESFRRFVQSLRWK